MTTPADEGTITITLGVTDALLLQGLLRGEHARYRFNEAVFPMLVHVEAVLDAAQRERVRRETPTELDKIDSVLGG